MIREQIKKRMLELNINNNQLAEETKIDRSNLHNFVKGYKNISIPKLEKILKYLDLKLKP